MGYWLLVNKNLIKLNATAKSIYGLMTYRPSWGHPDL